MAKELNEANVAFNALTLFSFDWDAISAMFMSNILSFLVVAASVVSIVVFIGIKAISCIYLYVLIIFGPLNIGLSFIPALAGMWKAWLQKFMSVLLWIPMLYLIDNFMLSIMDKMIDNLLQPVLDGSGTMDTGLVMVGIMLLFMNVFVYLKAPTLANFIVQGMEVGASQLKDKPKHYAKKAGKTALAAKTGGASAAAGSLMQ
jgi:hypothetical protein